MGLAVDLIRAGSFALEAGEEREELLAELREGRLHLTPANGAAWVEFTVTERERYTVLTIRCWEGIADRPGASLHVAVPADSPWQLTELDYMGTFSERDGVRRITWESPSKHFGPNPTGAFAVFEAGSDEAHDETLLHIWVDEAQPHPNTGAAWDLDCARRWLADWQKRFGRRSQMVVNGESLQELYDLVPYAEKAAIDEIYIFTNTWRRDAFWPMTDTNWGLDPKVFPNGRADLRAYSDYLAERGMRLALHYVSGGIGLHDPVYVGSRPHPELAAWGVGLLQMGIDENQGDVLVTPGDAMSWPLHERKHFEAVVIQVGDELVMPGDTVVQPDGNWLLSDCTRRAYDTVAVAHEQGTAVKFLVTPYGQNFVPDNNCDLLYEVADNYASLLNDCNVAHAEFDGAEIHCYDGRYGYIKFAQRIYEQVDHAISGHDSSASAPRCFFEYRFKSTQRVLRGACGFTHGNWLVPFQVDSFSRPASTVLDANFFLSQGHWGGAMGISKPEPMFGVTTDMLATHGMTDELLQALHDWKQVCPLLTEEQHQLIEHSLSKPDWPMPEASHHRVADVVYAVNCAGTDACELVPTRVMARKDGDIKWQLGQEHGPLSPRQFVRPGEALELVNTFTEQCPEFVIRVLPAYDRDAETLPISAVAADSGEVFDDKDFFVAGNLPGSSHDGAGHGNIDLLPDGFNGLLEAHNDDPGPAYQVNDLPAYPCRIDLSAHRGIGVELEGDGSGALVLVQLEGHGCRDYVIPADFEGLRYIEIPCGEVSWARANWGWRMGTKTMNYARVAQCRIGLGMVPAQSTASVRVKKLTALAEQHLPLENPCIRVGEGGLHVDGTIATGNYLVYSGGETADVYDPDWHHVSRLRTRRSDLHAKQGVNIVQIEATGSRRPWLEVQFLVRDEAQRLGGREG